MAARRSGGLAGTGYASLGVPQPVTWTAATALASFLAVIGTLMLAGYLPMDGHPSMPPRSAISVL